MFRYAFSENPKLLFYTLQIRTARERCHTSMAFACKTISAMAILVFLISCSKDAPKVVMLHDFETDSELDQLHWSCHTLFALSDEHATHGSKSLKLELYHSDYPGLSFIPSVMDWRYYRCLALTSINHHKNRYRSP